MSDLQTALRDYLLRADERALFHAMPRQIADALSSEPRPTLESLVEAMFRGDAVLHWELYCAECQFWTEEPDWLVRARHDYTCPGCGGTFDVHMDDEVQVTFSPHPTLRTLGPGANDAEFRRATTERFPPTTVHELMTVQAFRDWARDESLPSGEYLKVLRMVVWFSDLTGSTALYARNGDPLAFDLVREHFNVIFEVIRRHEGAVVKTMGDGIMAVFVSNARAVEAALAAHRALDRFNRERNLPADKHLLLKVGVHAGPAIAVTLNERLDYFGTTVNVAARVSDLARGNQTVFTEPVYADSQVQAVLAAYNVESFRTDIRGLEQPLLVCRLVQPRV
jgi:class 3 adenylate cyclase